CVLRHVGHAQLRRGLFLEDQTGALCHLEDLVAHSQFVFVNAQGSAGRRTGLLHRFDGGFLGTDHPTHSSLLLFHSERGTVLSSLYFSSSSLRAYSRRSLFISLAETFFSTVWPVFSSTTLRVVLLTPLRC